MLRQDNAGTVVLGGAGDDVLIQPFDGVVLGAGGDDEMDTDHPLADRCRSRTPGQRGEVILRRCRDQSDLGMSRHGVPVPAEHDEPVIQGVVVSRSENGTWLIDSSTETGEPRSA